MKFQIKSRWDDRTLFEVETTSLKLAVELAVKSKANLSGADLSWSYLSGAYLSRADLSRADLSGADLSWANLSKANLSKANLSRTYLSGANLSEARGIPKDFTSLRILLDQPGKIRAYKLVNQEDVGPFSGGIKYEIGKEYKVEADTDETLDCAKGINLADLPWCLKEWKPGYKILIAEFEAKDIAAIPIGTDGKFRVHRCKIVGEKKIDPVSLGLVKQDG